MAFDPKQHLMKLKGKDYLPVAARVLWFRTEHPDWGIVTSPIEINMEKQYAVFSASIFNADGKLMATATKYETVRGFPDWLEKAETGAVGRALAYCGYGTQFAPELEEGSRFADAPFGGNNMNVAPNRFGNTNGNGAMRQGNGNGGNGTAFPPRPMNAAPPVATPRPSAPPPPMPDEEGDFDRDDAPPARAASVPANRSAPVAAPPVGSGPTRVREPEPVYSDPGGEDDDEDPFDEEEEAAPVATPVRATTAAPRPVATASRDEESDDEGGPIAPPMNNRCAAEGCGAVMPPAMVGMTTARFGKPLCPVHQKGATPIIGGSVSVGMSGATRPRAKAGAAGGGSDTLL